jgi:glycosyltransferase involved in cell wall biosynthesis
MNICLISREYPDETGWGGIGVYTYHLAHGLAGIGNNVHVIAQSLDIDKEYLDGKVNVHRIAHKTIFPFKWAFREFGLRWEYSLSICRKLKEIIKRYKIDVVEAPNLSGESLVYSFHKKVPLVIRLHTHFSEVINFLNWQNNPDRRLSCRIEDAAVLRSDLITCSTVTHAENVSKELGIDAKKIKIIPLGVPLPDIQPETKAPNANPVILYVGRLERRKGTHVLIQAIPYVLNEFPNVDFKIVGRDSFVSHEGVNFSGLEGRSFKEQLIGMLPENCKDRVKFCGYVDTEELGRYYHSCDIFVAPSLYESFGLIYIEAMSYAKPVIGCGVGGVTEVVRNQESGILVPPEDPRALADAMLRLLKDQELRERMGEAARRLAGERFSRETMVNNTLEAYTGIIQQKIKR